MSKERVIFWCLDLLFVLYLASTVGASLAEERLGANRSAVALRRTVAGMYCAHLATIVLALGGGAGDRLNKPTNLQNAYTAKNLKAGCRVHD